MAGPSRKMRLDSEQTNAQRLYSDANVTAQDAPSELCFRPSRIVSGGQTGVDRGALDAAIELKIPHGGWCPAGRMAEDGTIPDRYDLQDNGFANYPARTRQNVVDSDATLILYGKRVGDGTRLTNRICEKANRPCLMLSIDDDSAIQQLRLWLSEQRPATLNVAGSRESSSPGIERQTKSMLVKCLSQ